MKVGGKFSADEYSAMQIATQVEMEGTTILLVREPDYEDDDEGGVIRADGENRTLAEQKFIFQEAAPVAHVARGTNFQQIIGYGQRATTDYVLVGYPQANIAKDDTFTYGQYEYKVTFVHPDRTFMALAEVERITSGNT